MSLLLFLLWLLFLHVDIGLRHSESVIFMIAHFHYVSYQLDVRIGQLLLHQLLVSDICSEIEHHLLQVRQVLDYLAQGIIS